jgi:hypothetical protein
MLAELKGSPKQISWALKIRADRLDCWRKFDPVIFQRVESSLDSETSAAWWITFRDKGLVEVLKYVQCGGSPSTVKSMVKTKSSSLPLPAVKKTYVSTCDDGGITRYVGELRDAVTGEVVIDPECPF